MFCTKCGNQINENSKFCTGCGSPNSTIHQEEVVEKEVSQKDDIRINDPKLHRVLKWYRVLMWLAFILWLLSRGAEEQMEGASILVIILSLPLAITMSVITGMQAKRITGSNWGYLASTYAMLFWGLAGYYAMKEFHRTKKLGVANYILSVVGIAIWGVILFPLYILFIA